MQDGLQITNYKLQIPTSNGPRPMRRIQELEEMVRRDPRYAYEAYEFVFAALAHTQKLLGHSPQEPPEDEEAVEHHVSGPQLLDGIRDLALREFGLMARTV